MGPSDFIVFIILPPALWMFWAAGLVGLLANYVSKQLKDEIHTKNLFHYLFLDHPGRTAASVMSMGAAGFAAVAVGLTHMELPAIVAAGFTSGWALDACINRGGDNFDPTVERRV